MMGLGVMFHVLGGGSKQNTSDFVGRRIKSAEQVGDALVLAFDDGTAARITDNGQSCCESRYMRTDDSLKDLAGRELREIAVTHSSQADAYGNKHEIAFLDIKTDASVVQFSFHNEHNGYYGGFGLSIEEVPR